MIIKEGVFDRIEQTFYLFKDNFVGLFLPFFVYNFLSVVVAGTISKYYMMKSIAGMDNVSGMDYFNVLNDPVIVMGIVVGAFLFILYLMLYIVVLLSFIKSVRQAAYSEEITVLENVKYGVLNFMNSMKTYWYIFAYVALIPAIIFIFGGIFFNAGFYFGNLDILKQIGLILMGISAILFIVFAIYRGVKSTFALYSAVDKDDFTKENFNNSLVVTDNNWARIVGNFMLVGILVSIIGGIVGSIIGIFSFFGGGGSSLIDQFASGNMSKDPEIIINTIKEYSTNFSIIGEILGNIVDNILNTIFNVFILIFTYLFYKRLEGESKAIKKEIVEEDNNERIEL